VYSCAEPGGLRQLAIGQPHRSHIGEQIEQAVEHRQFDAPSLAGALAIEQRRQDRLAGEDAAAEIGDRDAGAHRRASRLAGDRHVTADRLNDDVDRGKVPVFAPSPKPVTEHWMMRGLIAESVGVVDLQPFENAGPEIVDDDIVHLHEVVEDPPLPRSSG
jgi:hypothetical protein